jgi:uncharacterized membrane protein
MEFFWSYLHTHQFAVIAVVTIALVTIYFLFKNLIKLALIFVLILILVGGYFYLTAPRKSPEDIINALRKAKDQTERVVEKGKDAYQKSKDVLDKGKQISEDVSKILSKDRETPKKE